MRAVNRLFVARVARDYRGRTPDALTDGRLNVSLSEIRANDREDIPSDQGYSTMTLPDGNETRERAGSGAGEAPDVAPGVAPELGVAQALAIHQEQVDKAEASADERELAAERGRKRSKGPSLAVAEIDPLQADPFLAKAPPAPEMVAARTWKSLLLDYSAHAAMIVGLIGFAWTVSDHVVTHKTAAQIEAPTAVAAAGPPPAAEPAAPQREEKRDEVAELRSANERMAKDVDALRSELGSLQTALRQDRTPDQLRALAGELDGVKSGLSTVKGETITAIAALSGKIDKSQRETDAKVQHLAASGPLERQGVDTASTGSIAPNETKSAEAKSVQAKTVQAKTVQAQPVQAQPVQTRPSLPVPSHASIPVPVVKPAAATRLASAEEGHKDDLRKDEVRRALDERTGDEAAAKPAILPGWVVREVYQGVALIEGRRGPLEVVPGVSIPGAGIVKSIDRRGNGWTVTTTKGLLAYAAPPREVRRPVRDYYPDPRDDF